MHRFTRMGQWEWVTKFPTGPEPVMVHYRGAIVDPPEEPAAGPPRGVPRPRREWSTTRMEIEAPRPDVTEGPIVAPSEMVRPQMEEPGEIFEPPPMPGGGICPPGYVQNPVPPHNCLPPVETGETMRRQTATPVEPLPGPMAPVDAAPSPAAFPATPTVPAATSALPTGGFMDTPTQSAFTAPAVAPAAAPATAPPVAPPVTDLPMGPDVPTLGVALRIAAPMSRRGFLGEVPVRSVGF